ncbi:methylated-DNA--[protein]-cysteine S-methyltransferase [Coraliomargarita sp. W4R53]
MASLNDNLFTTLIPHAMSREIGCALLTRFGWVQIKFTERGLAELVFDHAQEPKPEDVAPPSLQVDAGARELSGHRGTSDSVFREAFLEWLQCYQAADAARKWAYLDLAGTEFQRSVWRALLELPFGARTSYGQIAADLGNSKASRAVGSAVGANPVSLLVPCHRVLPSTGKSGNYRWGADRKLALLDAEQVSGSDLGSLFA